MSPNFLSDYTLNKGVKLQWSIVGYIDLPSLKKEMDLKVGVHDST